MAPRVAALDFSPAMIAHLQRRLSSSSVQADVVVGDGQALPWADHRFHAAFSMFGLMFFPDRAAGFKELHRVLRPAGHALVSSWVAMDQVPLMFDAVSTLMAAAGAPPLSSLPPAPLSSPSSMRAEFEAAGFIDVVVSEHSVLVPFSSVHELLLWMVRSTAPIVLMKKSMGDAAFDEVFVRWKVAMIAKHGGGLPLAYPLVALFGVGRKP